MRSEKEIQDEIARVQLDISRSRHPGHIDRQRARLGLLYSELRHAITDGIPVHRLAVICEAEREGRLTIQKGEEE